MAGLEGKLEIRSSEDVVRVRQAVRALAMRCGLTLVDQTKIVTAASELARNTLDYGGGGTVTLESVINGSRPGVRLNFRRSGAGHCRHRSSVEGWLDKRELVWAWASAAQNGYPANSTIQSQAGEGTRIIVTRWKA